MSAAPVLDAIDRAVVGGLCRHGGASYQEPARQIGLSPTATADRVRRLVRTGVIRGFRAVVDAEQGGRPGGAPIAGRLRLGAERDEFVAALRAEPSIVEAVHVTGHFDYQLRVFCS